MDRPRRRAGRGRVGGGSAPAHGEDDERDRAADGDPDRDQPAGVEASRDDRIAPRRRDDRPDDRPQPDGDEEQPSVAAAERAEKHGHGQDRQDGQGRETLVGLRRVRRQGGHQRAPRARTEIGGRPLGIAGQTLAGPGQDHRQLPGTENEEDGQRGEMEPAADRRAEQARDVAPGQEATDDRQPELEPADRWVEQALGRRAERLRMDDQVPEPGADDRPRDDPDGHEGDVIGSQAAGTGEQTGQDQGRDDGPDQRDRTPAHGQVAEQLERWGRSRRSGRRSARWR